MDMILLLALGLLLLLALILLTGKLCRARRYKIRTEAGVQRAEYITIGGIGQYIQIRGRDRANPVMLILHGGPGGSMAYYSYGWQAELERHYTIVHWDQRGCGNTYFHDTGAARPTLELLLSDLDELVDYLRSTFDQEKVVLMGHSWGTYLGALYAGRRGEKVSAYVAVSQMLDFKKSEEVSAREAMGLARAAGRERDAEEIGGMLADLLAAQTFGKAEATALLKLRQKKEKYLPPQYPRGMGAVRIFSPNMTWNDFKWMLSFENMIASNGELYRALLSEETASIDGSRRRYEMPVILVAGARDWTTPRCLAEAYFDHISAPRKELIVMENAGHIPFLDRPDEFSEKLLNTLKKVEDHLT